MSSPDGSLVVTPQGYPMWVAWLDGLWDRDTAREDVEAVGNMTDDELKDVLEGESSPHLVVAWEYVPGHVPEPIVPGIGMGSGMPYFGLTAEEAFNQVLQAARRQREAAREFLRRSPQS